jgi:uncharacterized protein (TIGR03435 family)
MRKVTYAFALFLTLAAVLLLLGPPLHAQAAPSLAFDVVSIKRSTSGPGPAMGISPIDSDSILVRNATARLILGEAYDLRLLGLHDLILGLPAWADSETYDIDAKVAPADLPAFHKLLPRQRDPLLQPVLADRFHLVAHFETRTLAAYALVVAKAGPRLTPVKPAILPDGREDPGGITPGHDKIIATGATIGPLMHMLQLLLGRPVVDRTGLTGHYSFTLTCAPTYAMRPVINGQMQSLSPDEEALPDLFTAIQEQLGLRLEPVKAPVQVLVVDHIEKPSEN